MSLIEENKAVIQNNNGTNYEQKQSEPSQQQQQQQSWTQRLAAMLTSHNEAQEQTQQHPAPISMTHMGSDITATHRNSSVSDVWKSRSCGNTITHDNQRPVNSDADINCDYYYFKDAMDNAHIDDGNVIYDEDDVWSETDGIDILGVEYLGAVSSYENSLPPFLPSNAKNLTNNHNNNNSNNNHNNNSTTKLCFLEALEFIRWQACKVVMAYWFRRLRLAFIFACCVLLGLRTFVDGIFQRTGEDSNYSDTGTTATSLQSSSSLLLWYLQLLNNIIFVYQCIFAAEVCIDLAYYQERFVTNGWIVLDVMILLFVWLWTILKGNLYGSSILILRGFRLIRALRKSPPLRITVTALLRTIPRLAAVAVLWTVQFYMFSVLCTDLFQDLHLYDKAQQDDETLSTTDTPTVDYFSRLDKSMLTLFQMTTGGLLWSDVSTQIMAVYGSAWIVFVSYCAISTILFGSLVIAVVVDAVLMTSNKDGLLQSFLGEDNHRFNNDDSWNGDKNFHNNTSPGQKSIVSHPCGLNNDDQMYSTNDLNNSNRRGSCYTYKDGKTLIRPVQKSLKVRRPLPHKMVRRSPFVPRSQTNTNRFVSKRSKADMAPCSSPSSTIGHLQSQSLPSMKFTEKSEFDPSDSSFEDVVRCFNSHKIANNDCTDCNNNSVNKLKNNNDDFKEGSNTVTTALMDPSESSIDWKNFQSPSPITRSGGSNNGSFSTLFMQRRSSTTSITSTPLSHTHRHHYVSPSPTLPQTQTGLHLERQHTDVVIHTLERKVDYLTTIIERMMRVQLSMHDTIIQLQIKTNANNENSIVPVVQHDYHHFGENEEDIKLEQLLMEYVANRKCNKTKQHHVM